MTYQETRRLVRPGVTFCLCFSMAACGGGAAQELATPDAQPVVVAAVPATPLVAARATPHPAQDAGPPSAPVVLPQVGVVAPAMVAETSCGLNGAQGIQAELLLAVNAVRAAGAVCGTSIYSATHALNWNNMLQQSAANHSRDMAQNHLFSHVSSDGSTLWQRIQATGYSASAAGENIAAGQGSVQEVIASWLNSPGHCKNMLDSLYQEIGVACIRNDGAPYGLYWTMNLARP